MVVVDLAKYVLQSKFHQDIKASAVELIGVVCSVDKGAITNFLIHNSNGFFNELIARSKFDVHKIKQSVINVLCTMLIVCDVLITLFSNNPSSNS